MCNTLTKAWKVQEPFLLLSSSALVPSVQLLCCLALGSREDPEFTATGQL